MASVTQKRPKTADSCMRQWQRGTPQFPLHMRVHPTNKCNLHCKHCWERWGDYDKTYKSELSDERWLRLVDEAGEIGAADWTFVGGGDPFVRNKLVLEMFEKIRGYGSNGFLYTNGTLFRRGDLERIVEIGWEAVNVSLDGPTAEINDELRTGGFDVATKNMRQLAALKKTHGALFPRMGMSVVLTTHNCDKLDKFVELAADTGCDAPILLTGLITQDEMAREYHLTSDQYERLPEYITIALDRAKALGIGTNFKNYLIERTTENGTDMHGDYVHDFRGGLAGAACYEPWLSMSITPQGMAGPCCVAFEDTQNSIRDQSLEEVWYGPYFTQLREGMLKGKLPYYCSTCPSNLFLTKEHERKQLTEGLAQDFKIYDESTRYDEMNPVQRVGFLVGKGVRSIREHGVSNVVRRGREWMQLRK